MQALEIQTFIENLAPGLGPEEGFRYGNPKQEVTGILVCWMATLDAIQAATKQNCNLLICHEEPFFPYRGQGTLKTSICRRIELLAQNEITIFRAHGTLDRYCVVDEFCKALGLPNNAIKDGLVRTHVIPQTTLGELAQQVKKSIKLNQIRVVGNLSHQISRVGIAVGGIGLSQNISLWETLLARSCDVIITGETDEYAMRYATDSGVAVIETTHTISENPGLKSFAQKLQAEFTDLKVVFFNCGIPWQYV